MVVVGQLFDSHGAVGARRPLEQEAPPERRRQDGRRDQGSGSKVRQAVDAGSAAWRSIRLAAALECTAGATRGSACGRAPVMIEALEIAWRSRIASRALRSAARLVTIFL